MRDFFPRGPEGKPLSAQCLLPDHPSFKAGHIGSVWGGLLGTFRHFDPPKLRVVWPPWMLAHLHQSKLCIFAEGAVWDVRTLQQE